MADTEMTSHSLSYQASSDVSVLAVMTSLDNVSEPTPGSATLVSHNHAILICSLTLMLKPTAL